MHWPSTKNKRRLVPPADYRRNKANGQEEGEKRQQIDGLGGLPSRGA